MKSFRSYSAFRWKESVNTVFHERFNESGFKCDDSQTIQVSLCLLKYVFNGKVTTQEFFSRYIVKGVLPYKAEYSMVPLIDFTSLWPLNNQHRERWILLECSIQTIIFNPTKLIMSLLGSWAQKHLSWRHITLTKSHTFALLWVFRLAKQPIY